MSEFPTNAPQNYTCPICLGVQHLASDLTLLRPTDIVLQDDLVTVFVNSFFMGKKNAGHVIVVSNQHYENIYDLPSAYGQRVFDASKQLAQTMKRVYGCDGTTVRQNNEPAGDQHAFHFHQHVFPRYNDDNFNAIMPMDKRLADPAERAEYAERLRAGLVG